MDTSGRNDRISPVPTLSIEMMDDHADLPTPEEGSTGASHGQEPTGHTERPSGEYSRVARSDASNISQGTTHAPHHPNPSEHESLHQEEPFSTTALLPDQNHPSPAARQPRSKLSRYLSDWWLVESLSWILCALSIIAIVIILRIYDQKRLPQWPLSITINTAISVFATVSRVAMLVPVVQSLGQLKWMWFTRSAQRLSDFESFDQASRGAWGSLLLMTKLRGVHFASLGSFIMIMSLAFGPFAQQAVTYPLRLTPDPSGDARAARAQNYTVIRDLGLGAEDVGIPDPTMKSAIYTGLFLNDNDTIPSLVPICSTGNCTWPTYLTLGLCARVADVTNLLEYKCADTNDVKECNYTLPNGLSLMEFDEQNMVISTAQEDTPTISFPGPNVPILDFYIINTDLNATGSNISTPSTNNYDPWSGANALECSIQFCVQSVNTTVINGQHTTIQSEVWSNASLDNPTFSRGIYYELWLRPKGAASPYMIPQWTRDAITTWSSNVFTGSSTWSEYGNAYSSDAVQTFVAAMQVRPRSGHIVAVSNVLRNIALSMTNNIRTYGVGADITGTASIPETFVSAQWAWLGLPLGLIALSLVFLAATVLKGNHRKTSIWKSSSLAVLQGLDSETRRRLGGLDHLDVMDRQADKVRVRLDEGGIDEGWRLTEVQHTDGESVNVKEKLVGLRPRT